LGVEADGEMCYDVGDTIGLTARAEKGQTMKKNWLRGLLLGVSMALLLSGGVALAQSMSIEPYCNVCCDKCREPLTCDEGFAVSSSGWAADECLVPTFTSPGPWGTRTAPFCIPADGDGEVFFDLYLMCPECYKGAQAQILNTDIVLLMGLQPGDYGEWTLELEDTAGKVGAEFYFAEDCFAAMFVPEPGSILLLGSGLAGLAGYATLRLRSGQALRWRTRE
jgi:hypothetical protein